MKTYPFYSVLTQLKTFYDIVLEDDELENIGLIAWDKIGNKYTAIYHYSGKVVNGRLDLPCNADLIELVTSGQEQYQSTDNVETDNFTRLEIENYIEGRKLEYKALYSRGGMIPFQREGDTLIFNKNISNVRIIYKGVFLDENGLPYLNFKEQEAITAYCAYVITFRKAMATQNQATMQIAQMLEQKWNRACDNARTPIYMTQNDIDNIMDVKSSWDRKRYGVSFKLYQ